MGSMKRSTLALTTAISVGLLSGCATQSPPMVVKDAPQSAEVQKQMQKDMARAAIAKPTLKRKIALGRVSNETSYGKSLLRDSAGDPVGKQIADMLSKALTESGAYIVLERTDLSKLQDESKLTGTKQNLVGVDALLMGSLTEFGRKTVGETGFVSASKKQVAFAKIDVRVVDVVTGQSLFAASGAGESSTQTASTFGFGSQAGYDSTLNDSSIRQAISEVVNRLSVEFSRRPWQTSIIGADNGRYYISGGKSQGLKPGMVFSVQTLGEKIKSPQTGFEITLPGKEVAQIRVDALFGDTEMSEGAATSVISGSLQGLKIDQLTVREKEAM
ncbi:Curli biogenesis system outer membrane secretion channel CsgG [Massilia sp. PDC64]|nr:Curli biogenesis system outer membrane secretion channel CsgG [Massilia sp. PDC64]